MNLEGEFNFKQFRYDIVDFSEHYLIKLKERNKTIINDNHGKNFTRKVLNNCFNTGVFAGEKIKMFRSYEKYGQKSYCLYTKEHKFVFSQENGVIKMITYGDRPVINKMISKIVKKKNKIV